MKSIKILCSLFFFLNCSNGQSQLPEIYGFKHLQTIYKGDTIDILIKSKKGDERKRKPLFLFCQGSLPIPLIIKYKDSTGKQGINNVFVFNTDSLIVKYHLAIINKPYVPLVVNEKSLNVDLTYSDSTGKFPRKYIERNLLHYYVDRNIAVIKFLQTQPWISSHELVVAGHSEGSTIAAKIAYSFPKTTKLIYSGGNPLGRIVTMIEQQRAFENDTANYGEQTFDTWKNIINDPTNLDASKGDANKTTYEFSVPPMSYLEKLKIPVLITYGTKDYSSPFNDYFRVEMIRQKRTNFTFKAYIGVEHNFFPLKPDGKINYDVFNWDKVVGGWWDWLTEQ